MHELNKIRKLYVIQAIGQALCVLFGIFVTYIKYNHYLPENKIDILYLIVGCIFVLWTIITSLILDIYRKRYLFKR